MNCRPKALPVRPETIPAELKSLSRWVTWSYVEDRDEATGEVAWDKPPRNARTGGKASTTNKQTWVDFHTAMSAYGRDQLDGVGLVLDGTDSLVTVDLDKCRSRVRGIEPWAERVVHELNTYTEVSPSKTGLRLFLYGKLPATGRKKGPFECYSWGRYVTVTGAHLNGTPKKVQSRAKELLGVHKGIFGEPNLPTLPRDNTAPPPLEDQEIVRIMLRARNGQKVRDLWDGGLGGFPSLSEGDLALCNHLAFYAPLAERIDALFRQSGRFRAKWDRADYRNRTINKALEGCQTHYEPPKIKGWRSI